MTSGPVATNSSVFKDFRLKHFGLNNIHLDLPSNPLIPKDQGEGEGEGVPPMVQTSIRVSLRGLGGFLSRVPVPKHLGLSRQTKIFRRCSLARRSARSLATAGSSG